MTDDFLQQLQQYHDSQTEVRRAKAEKARRRGYVKSEAVKALELDWQRHLQAKYPDQPDSWTARPVFEDRTANGLTKCCRAWLTMRGCYAARVNVQGRWDPRRKRYIRTGATLGMADISAVIRGEAWQIEVKAGHDRPRPDQLKVAEQVRAAGGHYIFVRSLQDMIDQIGGAAL